MTVPRIYARTWRTGNATSDVNVSFLFTFVFYFHFLSCRGHVYQELYHVYFLSH